ASLMRYPCLLARSGRFFAAAVLYVSGSFAQFATETVNGREAVAQEVLVKFRATSSQQATVRMQAAAGRVGSESARPIGRRGAFRMRSGRLGTKAMIDRLLQDPQVEWAEPNYIIRAMDTIPNDALFPSQYGLRNTGQVVGLQAGTPLDDIGAVKA